MLCRVRHDSKFGLCALALLAGCIAKDVSVDSTKVAGSTARAAAATPAPVVPVLPDPVILGTLDSHDIADSAAGAMAVDKATTASVTEFGRMMLKDHHAMRVAGLEVAQKVGITPEATASAGLRAEKAAADSMNAAPKGAAWDRSFIDHALDGHRKALPYAQDAANSTENADLRAMIQQAAATVQKHLDRARELQGKLAATP